MKALLDTNILIRWLQGRLPKDLQALMNSDSYRWFVSSAVLWEVTLKPRLAEYGVTMETIEELVEELGATWLPIRHQHIRSLAELPLHHNDPFDRIMLAQARFEGMSLVTTDSVFKRYKAVEILS